MNTPKPDCCKSCSLDPFDRKLLLSKGHPVDILFVLDSPNLFSVANQKTIIPGDQNLGALEYLFHKELDSFLCEMKKIYGKDVNFPILREYAYTVSCLVDETTPADAINKSSKRPSTKVINKCSPILMRTIRELDPKVIIPVGDLASKALYIMFNKFDSVTARTSMVRVLDKVYPAIPFPKIEQIRKNDRAYTIATIAMRNVFDFVFTKKNTTRYEIDISRYVFPRTVDEVRDLIRGTIIPRVTGSNKDFLSVDIETNSKYAYHRDSKMIMISLSWGPGEACAIWYDSRHAAYSPQDVYPYIEEVLASDARKVFHNATFDYKFLSYKHGFTVRNLCWDTLLAQHLINENMKGFYNLEFLAGRYFPQFENYKKLALKKISVKDTLSSLGPDLHAPEEQEDDPDAELNDIVEERAAQDSRINEVPQDYMSVVQQYEQELQAYQEKMDRYAIEKGIYEQELALWKYKWRDVVEVKQKDVPKSELAPYKERKKLADAEKPVLPSKKDLVKPVKPDMTRFTNEDSKENFEDYEPQDLLIYAAMDADITRQICLKQKGIIQEENPMMFTIIGKQHVPAVKALSSMEYLGANTDQAYLDVMEKEMTEYFNLLDARVKAIVNDPAFNVNSAKQLAGLLFSRMGVKQDMEKVTATGLPKMGEAELIYYASTTSGNKHSYETLEALAKEGLKTGKCDIETFIGTVLAYRDVSKALNTTVKNYRTYTAYDGKLRCSYSQAGTATGRLNSASLNLQNLAPWGGGQNLKKFIIPDHPDHVLVNVDIKAAEIRCLMAYAAESGLIEAIKKGMDFHCVTSSEVWLYLYPQYATPEEFYPVLLEAHNAEEPTPFQKELQKLRKVTKAITFGLVYGITKYGLSRDLKCSETEAQSYIDSFFKRYTKIKKYMDDTESELRRFKKVVSLTGRARRFPRYELAPGRASRQGVNFKVQNIASDLVVRQLSEMHKQIDDLAVKELKGRLVLTVHDSILLSIPKKALPRVPAFLDRILVQQVQEQYKWLPVAFEYDWEIGDNYGELNRPTKELLAHYLGETHD